MSSLAYPPLMTMMNPADLQLRDRSLIVALVVLAHVLVLWFLMAAPSLPTSRHQEMSVSFAAMPSPPQPVQAAPQPKPVPKPEPKPVEKPKPVERRVQTSPEVTTPIVPEETPVPTEVSAPPQPVATPPGLPDREPDYQAAYLKNPVPAYPMVARRMGWQGKVVLNVEVLASGLPGEVRLYQSSGHDVLDKAAMQAVRSWKFAPARQGGQVITKWFLVPIPFILKED